MLVRSGASGPTELSSVVTREPAVSTLDTVCDGPRSCASHNDLNGILEPLVARVPALPCLI